MVYELQPDKRQLGNIQADKQTDGQTYKRKDEQKNKRKVGHADNGYMDRLMDRWTGGQFV